MNYLKLLILSFSLFVFCSCGDDEEVSIEEYVITGSDTVTSSYSNYVVNGLPNTAYVQWSINSSDFTVSRNGYNSAMVKCSIAGETAILKAEIVSGSTGEIFESLTKTITSK